MSAAARAPIGTSTRALALAAGGLQTASMAPLNLWPLGVLAAATLLHLLRERDALACFKIGWWNGFGLFLSGASWIFVSVHFHGNTAWPIAALIVFAFCATLGLFSALLWGLWGALGNRRPTLKILPGFAAAWVLGEWLRTWLGSGFPWLFLGYGHLDTALAGWAPVGGVLAVGAGVAVSAAACWLIAARRSVAASLAALALVWGGGWALRWVEWSRDADAAPIKAALVQANIDLLQKHQVGAPSTNPLYARLSETLWPEHDLVVWPETSVGAGPDNLAFLKQQARRAAEHDAGLIAGVVEYETDTGRAFNGIVGVGAADGRYRKRRLVPFGEFVPLENQLRGLIPFFNLPLSSFSRGDDADAKPLAIKDIAMASFVCYEIAYPDLVASSLGDSGALLTISEDAWFGDSLAPHQHLQISRMRALENHRPLLRATNTGLSAFIDHRGRVTQRSELMRRQILSGEIQTRQGQTPFTRHGSIPILALACAALALCLWPRRRRRTT